MGEVRNAYDILFGNLERKRLLRRLRRRWENNIRMEGYGLEDRGSRVRFPAGTGNFSLHHRVQTGSGAHPASYPMGKRGSFPGDKAAGA
jgi:hypothetical protein